MLRKYGVGGKLLNGIKEMYVNTITCARIKGDKNEYFRIDSGIKQGCILCSLGLSMCIWML